MSSWPSALRSALDALAAHSGGGDDKPQKAFGNFFVKLSRDYMQDENFDPFRAVLQECILDNWPMASGTVVLDEPLLQRRLHSIVSAAAEIEATISYAADYILASQRPDGSWEGAWGICFTWGMFFALESLEMVHQTYQTSAIVRKACDWLVSKQKSDGGWGEHWSSCELREYVQHEKSQVVNTSWAVLALTAARYPHEAVIERGLQVCCYPLAVLSTSPLI